MLCGSRGLMGRWVGRITAGIPGDKWSKRYTWASHPSNRLHTASIPVPYPLHPTTLGGGWLGREFAILRKASVKDGFCYRQAKEVQGHGYDLTVLKVRWGNLALKIYDKGGRVLRVEVVVHNAKELRCGKVLQKLPVLLEQMSGMLVRFLNTVQVAHVSFLDQGAFERWAESSTRGTRRLAGIDLNKARNRHVVDAVVGLATPPEGLAWRNWPRPCERAPIGGPKGIRSAKRRMIWP